MRRKPFTWLPRLLFKEPAVSPTAELRSRHARSSRVAHNGPAVYRTSPQFRHSCQLLHSNGAIIVAKPGVHANAAPSTQQSPAAHSVTLRVTAIDELFGRAKAAGARVLAEPADHCMANGNAHSSTHGDIRGRFRRRFSIPTQPTGAANSLSNERACHDTLPWLISFSLGNSLTSKGGNAVRWKAVRSLLA